MSQIELENKIREANGKVIDILNKGDPYFIGAPAAKEVIPFFKKCLEQGKHLITHAGPPVVGGFENFCGPIQGSMIGLCLFEGWCNTVEESISLLKSGTIIFRSNHTLDGVGSMAGTISENMPVWVCENRTFGTVSFARLSDEYQQFGNYNRLEQIIVWRDIIAPALHKAMQKRGGVRVKPLIAKALQMGDELHNRPNAFISLFMQEMTIAMIEASIEHHTIITCIEFFKTMVWGGLSVAMAYSKSLLLPAEEVPYSSLITAIARNGNEVGIRVAGLGKQFITFKSPEVKTKFICDSNGRTFTQDEACHDLGDSAITETVGLGAPIILGAMALAPFLGITRRDAEQFWQDTQKISHSNDSQLYLPIFNSYLPIGIDIFKCQQFNITPVIDTAVAHNTPGIGIVGNGISYLPIQIIQQAVQLFQSQYRSDLVQ